MQGFFSILTESGLQELVGSSPSLGLVAGLVACIAVLSYSADKMVDGAVHLARRTGMPRVLIGATVVAIGTSLPETFVSVLAAWMGNPGLALGNGVGSVICDTGLIFGLMCTLTPLPANPFVLNRTGLFQVGAATLLVLISLGLKFTVAGPTILGRWVGVLFLGIFCFYAWLSYGWAKQTGMVEGEPEDTDEPESLGYALFLLVAGLVGVILSSRVLIPVASELASRMGVPDDVIAATLVALGTSLPELVTALSAVKKGYPSIMLGTVVGSDVVNILFVIGASAVASPLQVPANFFYFHFPALLIILYCFRAFIIMNKGGNFRRWQGAVILSVYFLYLIFQYAYNLSA